MSQLHSQPEPTDTLMNAFNAAAEESAGLVSASLKTLAAESRAYFDDMARDYSDAIKDLQICKSPIELIGVEQKWLLARSTAYFDAGMRIVAGALQETESAAARHSAFHLPE